MNIQVIVRIICLIFFSVQLLCAQQKDRYENEDNQEQQEYDREFTFGVNWNTNGGLIGGVNAKFAWQHATKQTHYHFLSLEMVHVTHPKEVTLSNLTISPPQGSYIEGKIGNFFSIRPQFGREIVIFNKAQEEGVQVSALFAGGPSLGLMVPYYITYITKIKQTSANTYVIQETKNIPYDTSLDDSKIIESTGFFNSIGKGGVTPYFGLNSKVSLNFEYGQFKSSVTGFEVGMMMEYFPTEINIIPKSQNGHNFFFSFFVTAYFGVR